VKNFWHYIIRDKKKLILLAKILTAKELLFEKIEDL